MLDEIWCTACMSSEPHGNVVRKHADATCQCVGHHANKAHKRPMCSVSELGLHVWAGHTFEMAVLL